MTLFNKYMEANKISDALLIGRNMVNQDSKNVDKFCKYQDLLLSLAESLPAINEREQFANQAGVTLAFFEESADLSDELIGLINKYHERIDTVINKIDSIKKHRSKDEYEKIKAANNEVLKKLYQVKNSLEKVTTQFNLDKVLAEITDLDAQVSHDFLNDEQKSHYEQLNKEYTGLISKKMADIERKNNVLYNKKAVDAYDKAYLSFKSDEGKFKNQTQLFNLVSTSLFAYDASRLFNETLIYYNHVYAYIFSKLDDDGKLALTRYSIECERKLR